MTVTLVAFGDIIATADGDKQMVVRHCGHGESRAMYCATCKYSAPNPQAMRDHCRGEGEHEVVSFCQKHRIYETVIAKITTETAA